MKASSAQPIRLAADLELRRLGPGLWLHVSTHEVPRWGQVSANGLVVMGPKGTLLIDTPWTPAQTRRLLDWLRDSHAPTVTDVIVTHFHEDRLGGVPALPPSARVHALASTSELAAGQGNGFSAAVLPPDSVLELAGESVEPFFPGAGHAPDNLVVWLPARHLLFGGCFVRSAASHDLGNLSDADVASWRAAVERVIDRFPTAAIVVPGHGALGDRQLLAHTRELVEAALAKGGVH